MGWERMADEQKEVENDHDESEACKKAGTF